MSILSNVKRFAHNSLMVGAVTGAAVVAGLFGVHALQNAHAATYATNCDANAVIYCGAQDASDLKSKVDGNYTNPYKETSSSILNIYSAFHVSKADVDAMPGVAVEGTVTKTGDVVVNGKTVATGVTTAGREDISGSTKRVVNGTTFYTRAPSVSFLDASLPAMVVMKNGVFQFAIMNSCGNPVTGHATTTPPPPPAPKPATLTCNELDLTPGTVESNGDQNYTLAAQASTANGAVIKSYVFDFGDNSSKTVSTSSTSASTTHTYAPGTYTAKVTVNGTNSPTAPSTTNCEKSITIKKTTTPPPPPAQGSLVCDELTLTPAGSADNNGNVSYTLSAQAAQSASNASISGYTFTFGDSSQNKTVSTSSTSASTTHTYAPGTYTAKVTVNGTASGKSVTETSDNCSASVTVSKPPVTPVTPVYVCSELTMSPAGQADAQGNVAYNLTATASASNVTITSYSFDFGDNSQADTVTTADTSANATHTYAPGTYTAQVTVTVTLSDGTSKTVTADSCQTKITVAAPTCTSTTGQTYPAGSSQCQTCTAPSGQTYPAGSAQCTPTTPTPTPTPTPTTPTATSLPNTGPGDVAGLFSGVSMSGAGIHRILGNRRARRATVRR